MLRPLFLLLAFSFLVAAQSSPCLDARNLPVTIHEASPADFGHASLDKSGMPQIYFNTPRLKKLPLAAGTFILYHECGHHALGHLLEVGSILTDEQAADCWAARSLVLTGQFDANDIRTAGDSVSRLNRTMLNSEEQEPWRATNLGACLVGLPAAAKRAEQDGLAVFFQWAMITSQSAGTHFFLRTQWRDGLLHYVATVTDNKGRTAKHFAKRPNDETAPPFQIAFASASGERLFTLTISDSLFLKVANTGYYEAVGETPCSEDSYRASLEGARKTASYNRASHSWDVPADLR